MSWSKQSLQSPESPVSMHHGSQYAEISKCKCSVGVEQRMSINITTTKTYEGQDGIQKFQKILRLFQFRAT